MAPERGKKNHQTNSKRLMLLYNFIKAFSKSFQLNLKSICLQRREENVHGLSISLSF